MVRVGETVIVNHVRANLVRNCRHSITGSEQDKDKRSVRVIVAVDNIDDEKKERSLNDCKLRAGDLAILALPDFRPEPHEVTFRPEKIEKPDNDKLIALAGVPTFRDGNVYELHN